MLRYRPQTEGGSYHLYEGESYRLLECGCVLHRWCTPTAIKEQIETDPRCEDHRED